MQLIELMGFAGVLVGLCVAWALGANSSSGCVGTIVGCGMLSRRYALLIFISFLALGVTLEGWKNMSTVGEGLVGGFPAHTVIFPVFTLISMISAVAVVASATFLGVPVSMSQAIVGSVIGSGIALTFARPENSVWINTFMLVVIVLSWCLSPIFAATVALLVRKATALSTSRIKSISGMSNFMFVGLILSSAFTAYVFGANDLGASAGVFHLFFSGSGWTNSFLIVGLLGWFGVTVGALTYSTKVMRTVGSRITRLDAFTAFSAQLSTAAVVWLFIQMKIPVSTTHVFVGGLVGASLSRGVSTVNIRSMRRIASVWILVPATSMFLSMVLVLIAMALV